MRPVRYARRPPTPIKVSDVFGKLRMKMVTLFTFTASGGAGGRDDLARVTKCHSDIHAECTAIQHYNTTTGSTQCSHSSSSNTTNSQCATGHWRSHWRGNTIQVQSSEQQSECWSRSSDRRSQAWERVCKLRWSHDIAAVKRVAVRY